MTNRKKRRTQVDSTQIEHEQVERGLSDRGRTWTRAGMFGGHALLAAFLASLSGCHLWPYREQPRPTDIPAGAVPPPPGSITCAWHQAENAKAQGYDWVIAQHQWYQGGEQLGPDGQERLARLAARWHESPRPVVIEPHTILVRRDLSEDYGKSEPQLFEEATKSARELDERRRLHVVEQLASRGFEDAHERVVIARPPYDALYGQDAEMAFQQVEFGGMFGGRGGGFGGGMGNGFGGGFGGMGGGGFGGGGFGGGGFGGGGFGGGFGGGGFF